MISVDSYNKDVTADSGKPVFVNDPPKFAEQVAEIILAAE